MAAARHPAMCCWAWSPEGARVCAPPRLPSLPLASLPLPLSLTPGCAFADAAPSGAVFRNDASPPRENSRAASERQRLGEAAFLLDVRGIGCVKPASPPPPCAEAVRSHNFRYTTASPSPERKPDRAPVYAEVEADSDEESPPAPSGPGALSSLWGKLTSKFVAGEDAERRPSPSRITLDTFVNPSGGGVPSRVGAHGALFHHGATSKARITPHEDAHSPSRRDTPSRRHVPCTVCMCVQLTRALSVTA